MTWHNDSIPSQAGICTNNNNMSVSHGNYVSANIRHDTDELE